MSEDPALERFKLHAAAREGNASLAESLIKSEPHLLAQPDDDGRVPLHWATSSKSQDIISLLAQHPKFDPNVQDDSGWTPLMIAASLSDSDSIVALLLSKGADINQQNHNGQTALHFVASKNNLDIAKLLFAAKPPASSRVRDKRGQYPIHRASAIGSAPMVTLLLRNKSPINASDIGGYTPLHHAIAEGHGDVAIVLLKEGADATKKNNDGILAIDLSPDREVRKYIERTSQSEGIEM